MSASKGVTGWVYGSTSKSVIIWCDGVDCLQLVEIVTAHVRPARRKARREGWEVVAGRDLCPQCLEHCAVAP